MVSQWAAFNALLHSGTAEREIPPRSQVEADKKTNWAKVSEYADWLERRKFEIEQARVSPQHFGKFLDMPEIMGEPEDWMTFEEYQEVEAVRKREAAEASLGNLMSIFEEAARRGASLVPAEPEQG